MSQAKRYLSLKTPLGIGLFVSFLMQSAVASDHFFYALLTQDDAAKMVMRQGGNKVLAAKTTQVNGKIIFIFKVLSRDGRIYHIKIDAESGRQITALPQLESGQ